MTMHRVGLAVLAACAWGSVLAGEGSVTNLASAPELWKANAGSEASIPPEMSVVKAADGSQAVQFTVRADGVYQGADLVPDEPIVLEPGDILKMKLRQTAEKDPVSITLNGQFTCGSMNTVTRPIANKWTEVTVALDPANWRSSRDTPKEFGALKKLAIYPARRLDQTGEVLAIAEMQIVKADGTLRTVPVPDSLRPTEVEAKWMEPANWKGYLGNLSVKTPPQITVEETADGKAVVARAVAAGPYQGIEVDLPEAVDLAKVKAITFDVRQETGVDGSCCVWLFYAEKGGVRCSVSARNKEWTPVRLTLDFDPKTFTAIGKGAELAPGMLKRIVVTRYGYMDAPGESLAVRNLHFVMKPAN